MYLRAVVVLFAGICCSLGAGTATAAVRIITTTQDLTAIAREIGGDQVDVESLTPGTRDPHFAVAKPSMIRKVSRADLLLIVGADMEIGWLPPLLQSARNSRVLPGNPGFLDLSQSVPLLGVKAGPQSRALGDVHAKGNPHYWLDPRNGIRMAQAIAARLAMLDPDHADEYAGRSATFSEELTAKYGEWREALAFLQGQPVIAYHTSFNYLAAAFDFEVADEVEPKPGISPSAASLSALVNRIKSERIPILIMEPYYERRSAQYLAGETGISVAVLPQSVGAEKNIETYQQLFDGIVAAFLAARGE